MKNFVFAIPYFEIVGKTLVKYKGKGGNVTIPDGITTIGERAFYNCSNLISITIPDSVTSIGELAFRGCSRLTKIIIPDSVTNVEFGAFSYCSSLTKITIGNGVARIGDRMFGDCSSLTSIVAPNSVTSIGDAAFSFSSMTSVAIPGGVTDIGNWAFYKCSRLTSVTVPESVTRIRNCAFEGCSSLHSKKANYKAFHITEGKLMCRDKSYAVGQMAMVRGELKLCENGIHYCTNLFDVFNYYSGEYGKDFVIGLCDVSNQNIGGDSDDSKRCARWIIPTKILTREEVIEILNNK